MVNQSYKFGSSNLTSSLRSPDPALTRSKSKTCLFKGIIGIWCLEFIPSAGVGSLRSPDPALTRSKSKTSQPAVAIFVFTKCRSKLRISHKTKTRLCGRVLLSLVTWLGSEPMALKSVRIEYLQKFTSRVDDL